MLRPLLARPIPVWLPYTILAIGLFWRFCLATTTYLNPDEALHFAVGRPGLTLSEVYWSAVSVHHPPLLIFLLNIAGRLGIAEWWLRLGPVLAGSLFPLFAGRWVERLATPRAGFLALCLLSLSPNIAALSAQIRGYSLMLLFAAIALDSLEGALETGSRGLIAIFSASLFLAILTEYSAVWLAVAVGLYALARLSESGTPFRLKIAWACGQAAILAACGLLYVTAVRPLLDAPLRTGLMEGYLRGGFPAPGQSLAAFGAVGFVKQFAYLTGSVGAGVLGCLAFAAALPLFRRRSQALLMVAPAMMIGAAAMIRFYPFARTRHTVVLSLFLAAGIAVAWDAALRRWPRSTVAALLLLIPLWMMTIEPDQQEIARYRNSRKSLQEGIAYLVTHVPHGDVVFTDRETALILEFYMRGRGLEKRGAGSLDLGPFQIAWRGWDFGDLSTLEGELERFRKEYAIGPEKPVWIVDGGFQTVIAVRIELIGALQIFRYPQ